MGVHGHRRRGGGRSSVDRVDSSFLSPAEPLVQKKSPPQPPLPATFSGEERPRETQRDSACRGDVVSPTTTADFAHDPDEPLQNRPSAATLFQGTVGGGEGERRAAESIRPDGSGGSDVDVCFCAFVVHRAGMWHPAELVVAREATTRGLGVLPAQMKISAALAKVNAALASKFTRGAHCRRRRIFFFGRLRPGLTLRTL